MNGVTGQRDKNDAIDNAIYDSVNYFNDDKFAEQVALHQLLYRKLLKYAYENDAIVDDWSDLDSRKFFLSMNVSNNKLYVDWDYRIKQGCSVCFSNREVAEQAIEEVVKPFMKEHPEFVW